MNIRHLARRLAATATIAAVLRRQKALPYLPSDRIRARRDRAVRRIVAYAARNVPHYTELFARERIDPRSIRSADDLALLPILNKETIRSDPSRTLARTRAGRTAERFVTSGSTGTPIEVWHDRRSLLANLAYGERERAIIVRACGGNLRPRELNISYPSATLRRVWSFYDQNTLIPVRPRRTFVSILDPLDEIVEAINAERPEVIVGYGSFLEMLYRYVDGADLDVHAPRMIMHVADGMTAPGRELIESRFKIPVYSRYNAMESFKIGFTCEERNGFHVHEDLCHVRIVRDDGSPADPGESGEIVLSNLVNHATVLLGYRIGDRGRLSGEPCPCGRSLALLSDLEGRSEDVLTTPEGSAVHPRAVWGALKTQAGLLRYQLVQSGRDRFELALVTDDDAYEGVAAAAREGLRLLFGPAARVEIRKVDRLAAGPTGKFRPVLRRYSESP